MKMKTYPLPLVLYYCYELMMMKIYKKTYKKL
jgi:hypothetical protein